MNQSETVKRIESVCKEFDSRVNDVGLAIARLELAKAMVEHEAESAGRLKSLFEKQEDARQEWQRAENAEAALELARKQCDHLEHENAALAILHGKCVEARDAAETELSKRDEFANGLIARLHAETDKRPHALPGSPYLIDELIAQFERAESARDDWRAKAERLEAALKIYGWVDFRAALSGAPTKGGVK